MNAISLVGIVINKCQELSVNRRNWLKFDVFRTSVFLLAVSRHEDSQRSDFLRASSHSLEVSKGISSIQIFFISYE